MTLDQLAKILRRAEPTTAVRALRDDVCAALATDRTTDAEAAALVARAVALDVVSSREVAL